MSFQFNESVVRHRFRKQMTHMSTHILNIEMLQASVPGVMEQDEYGNHFRTAHQPITMVLTFLLDFANSYSILFNILSKTLLKSMHIEKISIILPSGNIAVVFIVLL